MLLDFERLGGLRWLLGAIGTLACAFLLLPIVFIVLLSFGSSRWLIFPPPAWTLKWYGEFFANPQWIQSVLASAKVGILVAVCSVVLGFWSALAITRGTFPGKSILRVFLLMPMVLPVVVLAVGIYSLFLRVGLNGTLAGFVLAHLVIALPFSVIVIGNALLNFDKAIEDAAILCGASSLQAKLRVTIPAIRFSLFTAAIFSFLASWDEIVIAIFMASPTLQTFPVKIWTTLRQDLTPVIAAASSLMVLLTIVLLLISALLMRRRG
ncbi:ABC transporter permease [Hypericibacter terrae]|jgi:putative spermidine/putrescine transport system permease protein|uniref:ABC transporter permease n=1 Tax=Hypericibacter terrae TaxID=2602015 RepID=A0A5J6MIR1_9PROT|nr:ABC transporter permease [Hypericibacter terrae]QEX17283.1 ABC transporter permease [Hypericibacter terrae]